MASVEQGIPKLIERNPVEFIDTPTWAVELKNKKYLPKMVVISDPLSYCAGVEQAVNEVEKDLDGNNLFHPPIHNVTKLNEWEAAGATRVESVEEVEDGSKFTISAHGASNEVIRRAIEKKLKITNLICPLVDRTRRDARRLREDGYKTILIGDAKHDEIVGTISEAPDTITVISPKSTLEQFEALLEKMKDEPKLAIRTQTTLNAREMDKIIDHVESIRPDINKPLKSDICYATQNRQDGVIKTIELSGAGLMIIFGSGENSKTPSSNSMRLREVGEDQGVPTYLVEDISEICAEWFDGVECVGVSAGASADPKRVSEFLMAMKYCGLKPEQLKKVKVADEEQVFSSVERFTKKIYEN